ncbi:hypothetical protein L2E82_02601 [Cichorium intybus]|uniref:Uncharacterized protein n=1 Tax=Cichorium intybus TaxID=13427 RepID=A0ACB9H2M3_CICIN|nr:hypothetical protein L2E82_02601 [Cichorium intybus]
MVGRRGRYGCCNYTSRSEEDESVNNRSEKQQAEPNQTRSKDNKNWNLYSHKNREETRSTTRSDNTEPTRSVNSEPNMSRSDNNREETRSTTRSDNTEPTRSVNSEPNMSRSSRCGAATNMPPRRLSFLPLRTHRWLTPKPSSLGTGSNSGGWLPPLVSSLDFKNRRLSRLPSPLVVESSVAVLV